MTGGWKDELAHHPGAESSYCTMTTVSEVQCTNNKPWPMSLASSLTCTRLERSFLVLNGGHLSTVETWQSERWKLFPFLLDRCSSTVVLRLFGGPSPHSVAQQDNT